jgi:hypothetical protein
MRVLNAAIMRPMEGPQPTVREAQSALLALSEDYNSWLRRERFDVMRETGFPDGS